MANEQRLQIVHTARQEWDISRLQRNWIYLQIV